MPVELGWFKHSTCNREFPGSNPGTGSLMVTVTKRFKVREFDDDYVWVELLEGEKQGFLFALRREELEDVEVRDVVDLTLENRNERKTAWKCLETEHI